MAKLTASNMLEALARGQLTLSNLNGVISIAIVQHTEKGERVMYRMFLDDTEARAIASFIFKTLEREAAH